MQLTNPTPQCRLSVAVAMVIVLVASLAGPHAAAQVGRRGRQLERPQKERLSPPLSGTLKQVIPARRLILVETAEKQKWLVQVTPKTTATIQGEVGPNFLRPGMMIRFYGKLARKTKAVEPIEEIVVVTPDADFRPGVFEAGEDEELSDEEGDTTPDEADEEDGADDHADHDDDASTEVDGQASKNRSTARGKTTRDVQATRYWISGQLRSFNFKRGAIVVQAGKSKVRADVTESTRVVVEAKDLLLARPGDAVVVHGSKYGVGQAEATKIEITLAETRTNERAVKDPKTGKQKTDAKAEGTTRKANARP